VLVPYSTSISSFEVFFTGPAHRQARVWELDIEGMFETRRRKIQNVLYEKREVTGQLRKELYTKMEQ
jgi:hypothetical protein